MRPSTSRAAPAALAVTRFRMHPTPRPSTSAPRPVRRDRHRVRELRGRLPARRADEDELRVERAEHERVDARAVDHARLGRHPLHDEDVGALGRAGAQRHHALHERLVVAGREQLLGGARAMGSGGLEVRAELHERRGAVLAAGGDRLREGDADAEAIEGADEAEADGGDADLAAGGSDEEGAGMWTPGR